MDWFENDELFRRECAAGHAWERHAGHFFLLHGFETHLGKQTIRDHVSQAHRYAAQLDLTCEGVRFEVKSRNVVFHTPDDFPFETIFVDTVGGWDQKPVKPNILLCISRETGAIIWLPTAATKDRWAIVAKHDNVRSIDERFYEAPKRLWRKSEELVDVLRKMQFRRKMLAPDPEPEPEPPAREDFLDWREGLEAS